MSSEEVSRNIRARMGRVPEPEEKPEQTQLDAKQLEELAVQLEGLAAASEALQRLAADVLDRTAAARDVLGITAPTEDEQGEEGR